MNKKITENELNEYARLWIEKFLEKHSELKDFHDKNQEELIDCFKSIFGIIQDKTKHILVLIEILKELEKERMNE